MTSDDEHKQASKGSDKGGSAREGVLRGSYKGRIFTGVDVDSVKEESCDEEKTKTVNGSQERNSTHTWPSWRLSLVLALIFGIICYCLAVPLLGNRLDDSSCVQRSWSSLTTSQRHRKILGCSGPYTPFVPSSSNYSKPDFGEEPYEISQVLILQRHTARYPTETAYRRIMKALRKVQRLPDPAVSLDDYLRELEGWQLDEKLGQLTDNGREMAYRFGQVYAERYPGFTSQGIDDGAQQPFVRSSGSSRVVESGGYIINALRGDPFSLSHKDPLPLPDVVFHTGHLSQDHNPIGEKGCQRGTYKHYQREGTRKSKRYLETLSHLVLPHLETTLGGRDGYELEPIDAAALMSLCAFTSQEEASRTAGKSPSMWCDMFEGLGEEKEMDVWRRYAYWYDVTKWYVKGQGNPATRSAGVGWINELIARLTDSEVSGFTDTNRTLDMDPRTFPRGGRRMFIDLSHDNRMLSILTALGVLQRDSPLPEYYDPLFNSGYPQGELSPFGMNLIVERYSSAMNARADDQTEKPDLIRLLLNDMSVIPVKAAQTVKPGSFLMTLNDFMTSQSWALKGGEWTVDCAADDLTTNVAEEEGDEEEVLGMSDSSG